MATEPLLRRCRCQRTCAGSAEKHGVLDQVLKTQGVPFKGINVLADPDVREGVKARTLRGPRHCRQAFPSATLRPVHSPQEFSNWPTVPQLYIGGEFIGGCDITVRAASIPTRSRLRVARPPA